VESRIRNLIKRLEFAPYVSHVHPWADPFVPPAPASSDDASMPHCETRFLGLEFKPAQQDELAAGPRRLDIGFQVNEFIHEVQSWESYLPSMDIHVSHVRRPQLPNWVFPGGHRPSAPRRKAEKRKSSEVVRSSSSAGVAGTENSPGENSANTNGELEGGAQTKKIASGGNYQLTRAESVTSPAPVMVRSMSDAMQVEKVRLEQHVPLSGPSVLPSASASLETLSPTLPSLEIPLLSSGSEQEQGEELEAISRQIPLAPVAVGVRRPMIKVSLSGLKQ